MLDDAGWDGCCGKGGGDCDCSMDGINILYLSCQFTIFALFTLFFLSASCDALILFPQLIARRCLEDSNLHRLFLYC